MSVTVSDKRIIPLIIMLSTFPAAPRANISATLSIEKKVIASETQRQNKTTGKRCAFMVLFYMNIKNESLKKIPKTG